MSEMGRKQRVPYTSNIIAALDELALASELRLDARLFMRTPSLGVGEGKGVCDCVCVCVEASVEHGESTKTPLASLDGSDSGMLGGTRGLRGEAGGVGSPAGEEVWRESWRRRSLSSCAGSTTGARTSNRRENASPESGTGPSVPPVWDSE